MTGLWGIEGNLRSGKTWFLTWLAYQQYKNDIPVVTNYKVKFAELCEPAEVLMMKVDDLVEEHGKLFMGLDDIHRIMDSRQSMTGENKIANDMVINSGKDGITIAGTAQLKGMVDLRFRELCDFYVLCERRGRTNDRNALITAWIGKPELRARHGMALKPIRRRVDAENICDMYDTREKIQTNKRLKYEKWAELITKKDSKLVEDLRDAATLTVQRELLFTFQGVKRSEQVAVLSQLGVLKKR